MDHLKAAPAGCRLATETTTTTKIKQTDVVVTKSHAEHPLAPFSQLKNVVNGILCCGPSMEASEGFWPRKLAVVSSRVAVWEPGPWIHSSETRLSFYRSLKTTVQPATFKGLQPSGKLTPLVFMLCAPYVRGTAGRPERGWDVTFWHFLPNFAYNTQMGLYE